MTISNDSRARVKKAFEPIALGMGRLGLTPDALTLIGFAITVIGAVLVAGQLWLAGGIVIFLGGVFDMFDGTLARATGKVSNLGAFYDSVFDRAGEVVVYIGIVVGSSAAGFSEAAVVATVAMGAAVMVSYARAKSEGLGFTAGSGMAAVGIMPREVRLVILSLGLVLAGSRPYIKPGQGAACIESCIEPGGLILLVALAIIAIGATITTIQRILHVRRQARRQSP
ncbi:MAG: CDP-alcohol phosphatidyltransferase family protein [Chloroflexi bacterium]|nr:CDP-alcohol phosphatidyltransferase family protein [Chloroflexota bacterium]